jgi:diguanylate cyclase (GGDEF)-like protein
LECAGSGWTLLFWEAPDSGYYGATLAALATGLAPAAALAGQISSAVAQRRITRADDGNMGQVTLSIGIAVAEEGGSLERLMQRADTALYRAKRAGRNRVELANGPAY